MNRQAVARNLPPDAALVEIARFNVFDFQAVAERLDESHWRPPRQWQPARYLAFVLRAAGREDGSRGFDSDGESPWEMIDPGEAEPIDELVSGFQSRIVGLHRGLSFGDAKSPDAANEAGRSLRAAVFDPIALRLDNFGFSRNRCRLPARRGSRPTGCGGLANGCCIDQPSVGNRANCRIRRHETRL